MSEIYLRILINILFYVMMNQKYHLILKLKLVHMEIVVEIYAFINQKNILTKQKCVLITVIVKLFINLNIMIYVIMIALLKQNLKLILLIYVKTVEIIIIMNKLIAQIQQKMDIIIMIQMLKLQRNVQINVKPALQKV